MPNHTNRKKYLSISPADKLWGLTVTSVGKQSIAKNEAYPPHEHPKRYLFDTNHGRILDDFQLLYITRGKGEFATREHGRSAINEGYMFLLFPGQWHTYKPDTSTGWNEYWIGFDGEIIKNWVRQGFFSKEKPIFNVGFNEDIVSLYDRALIIADAQEANYQQALAGIVCNLLSMSLYLSRNLDYKKTDIETQIGMSKIAVYENIRTVTPESLAQLLCMSYSRFRKIFKEYTGFAPSQYIQEVRISMAKEMLTNTSKSIKEIAYELGYENKDYFFTVFRKSAGVTPVNYRRQTRGENITHTI